MLWRNFPLPRNVLFWKPGSLTKEEIVWRVTALIVLAFTFLGDGLRDALDPRMRGAQ